MRTSIFEVQTHAARRDGQKASRANHHNCFDFFHDSGFHSEVKLTTFIFEHDVTHKSCDRVVQCSGGEPA